MAKDHPVFQPDFCAQTSALAVPTISLLTYLGSQGNSVSNSSLSIHFRIGQVQYLHSIQAQSSYSSTIITWWSYTVATRNVKLQISESISSLRCFQIVSVWWMVHYCLELKPEDHGETYYTKKRRVCNEFVNYKWSPRSYNLLHCRMTWFRTR